MWKVHETGCFPSGKEGMILDSFSSLEVREAATAPGIFLRKRNQMMLFETIFSRLHFFVFGVFGGYFFFFFAFKVPKWRVCDRGLFSLFRGIMPDQEGSTNSSIFF